jgi:hypothetical protein
MVRVVLVIALLGAGFIALSHRSGQGGESMESTIQGDLARVPPQFRSLLASRPDPAAILSTRGALPGLGAIRRLAGGDSGDDAGAQPPGPFADVGSRSDIAAVRRDVRSDLAVLNRLSASGAASEPEAEAALASVYSTTVLTALGPKGRRAFAARLAGATGAAQRIRVLSFDGVFASGDRALAQVTYRLSVRAPSGHFVAHPVQEWTVTLAREAGYWRFVRGFDSAPAST